MSSEVIGNVVQIGVRVEEAATTALLQEVQRMRSQLNHLEEQVCQVNACRQSSKLVRTIIKNRAARSDIFDGSLFADPAWDMLLELFASRLEQQRISVSKLCLSTGVPTTTGLRWIEKLQTDGLVQRQEDPFDGRRVWVQLTEAGVAKMSTYFNRFSEGPSSA